MTDDLFDKNNVMAKTSSNTAKRFYLPQLDGLRFLAFFLVFLHHAPFPFAGTAAGKVHQFGWVGVELFFILSAFLMTSLLLKEYEKFGKLSVSNFYVRRVLRIWPLYFFALLVGFVLIPIATSTFVGSPVYQKLTANYLLPYTMFFANIPVAVLGYPTASFPALAHLWTISFEEQFYLVLPLLIVVLAPSKTSQWLKVFLLILALALGVRTSLRMMQLPNLVAWVMPIAQPDSFVVGMAIALGIERHDLLRRITPSAQAALLLFAALSWMLVVSFPNIDEESWHMVWQYTVVSLCMGSLLVCALKSDSWLAAGLAVGPLKYLGKISYGLYVYHVLGIKLSHYLVARWGSSSTMGSQVMICLEIVIAFIFTVTVSAISYRWLEKPFLRKKAQFETVKARQAY